MSGLALSRAFQRLYESAWDLRPRGLRGTLDGFVTLGILLSGIVVLTLPAGLLQGVPAGSVIAFALRAGISVLLWLALQYLLVGGRVSGRRLLPGAVVAGVGQQLAVLASAVRMPRVIEVNAARYGVIGVAFAMLSWLLVIAVVIVVSAVFSVELGRVTGPDTGRTTDREPSGMRPAERLSGNRLATLR